jgi:hypothetical protein
MVNANIMEEFEAALTGTDGLINGIVSMKTHTELGQVYEFNALDQTLMILIARDNVGNWHRISGTEPYLIGWVDELGFIINNRVLF